MSTKNHLINQFGVLMTLDQLAILLKRSKDGLRITLNQSSPLSKKLNTAKIKIGRRIHFKTEHIAEIIDSGCI